MDTSCNSSVYSGPSTPNSSLEFKQEAIDQSFSTGFYNEEKIQKNLVKQNKGAIVKKPKKKPENSNFFLHL